MLDTAALVDGLAWIGAAVLVWCGAGIAARLAEVLTCFYFARGNFDFKRAGRWAVVTGSTDGIGKEYAEQLACKGLNIVLVSRSPTKLADVAKIITTKYNVETKIIVADFTGGLEVYQSIKKQLEEVDVGVLVNNVGMLPTPLSFLELPGWEKTYPEVISCNALSAVQMTNIILPRMLQKRYGAIINVSSVAGCYPHITFSCVYGSTKRFMSTVSRALSAEYKSQGIVVQNVMPGFVRTNMIEDILKRQTPPTTVTASYYVRSALNVLGVSDDTHGCLPHYIFSTIVARMPTWLWKKLLA